MHLATTGRVFEEYSALMIEKNSNLLKILMKLAADPGEVALDGNEELITIKRSKVNLGIGDL